MTNSALQNLSDEELFYQLKKDCEEAFSQLYKRYWQQLFYMAYKRLGNMEDAKEIVQDIFFTVWKKRHTLNIQCIPVYLAGMLRFAVYRQLSNAKRNSEMLKDLALSQANRRAECIDVDNKHLLEILTRFTESLPEKYRIVFVQHKLLDRPLEEVAEEIGVAPRTAEGYVTNVMKLVRKHRNKLAINIFLV